MHKGRVEAFSDGVLAIVITIMVLELKVPHQDTWDALLAMKEIALCYLLSFIYIAIYWNNHHHLFQATKQVNGKILWANTHLLFWLTLLPFATGWMGENHFTSLPTLFYGFVLLMAAISYFILTLAIIHHHGRDSTLAQAIGNDLKGKISVLIYALTLLLAFPFPLLALAGYTMVAFIWLIPDKRLEKIWSA